MAWPKLGKEFDMSNDTTKMRQRLALGSTQSDTGCWEWDGTITAKGYGSISWHSATHRAHRVAYQVFVGEIPDNMCVCHTCDNRKCVNPAHLFLGTYADNNADRAKKGRSHGGYKLTHNDVLEIRRMLASGQPQRAVASRFSVNPSLIGAIAAGRVWKERGL